MSETEEKPSDQGTATPYATVAETKCPACGASVNVEGIEPFSRIACPSCGAQTDVPAKLGHFLLLRRLGAGGMGATFLAEDETLGRKVAVKVMQNLGADEKAFETFRNEAQSAARLNHPHVAQIYSFGKEGDIPYLAMELVPGGDLASLAEKAADPLDPAFVLRVGLEIAEGLKAAEDAGLFHGDVKPDNILFDENGGAKLVDFGIASRSSQGAGDELWGTPYYIAPEKVQQKKNSARSDIYSLGATLYHAIAGRPPYDGADAVEVIKARFKGPPPPLETIRPDIEPEVSRIVSRMMYNDLFMRYPNYTSLVGDLKKYLDGVSASRKAGPLADVAAAARRTTGPIEADVHDDAHETAPGGKKKFVIRKGSGGMPARPAPAPVQVSAAESEAPAQSVPRLVPDAKPKGGVNGIKIAFFAIVAVLGAAVLGGVGYLVHMVQSSAAAQKRATAICEEARQTAEDFFGMAESLEAQRKTIADRDAAMETSFKRVSAAVHQATGNPWDVPDLEPPPREPEPAAEPAPEPAP
ncbi:MAG: protein kinase, partial [Kiritimatiellae bacterium]|nr:protein kinase [Kiritimatiellia bacterium]